MISQTISDLAKISVSAPAISWEVLSKYWCQIFPKNSKLNRLFSNFYYPDTFGSPPTRHDDDDPIAADACEEPEAGEYYLRTKKS